MNLLTKIKTLWALKKAANNIGEAYKMNNGIKPGYRTTEFWMTVATNLIAIIGTLKGVIPEDKAAIALAIANGVYAIARSLVKSGETTNIVAPH